jgi:hypothetical protein
MQPEDDHRNRARRDEEEGRNDKHRSKRHSDSQAIDQKRGRRQPRRRQDEHGGKRPGRPAGKPLVVTDNPLKIGVANGRPMPAVEMQD